MPLGEGGPPERGGKRGASPLKTRYFTVFLYLLIYTLFRIRAVQPNTIYKREKKIHM